MSLTKMVRSMTDTAAILYDIYGRGGARKKIAREFGVSLASAQLWLAGRFPENRTEELRAAVREEIVNRYKRLAEIEHILGITDGGGPRKASGAARRTEAGSAVADRERGTGERRRSA